MIFHNTVNNILKIFLKFMINKPVFLANVSAKVNLTIASLLIKSWLVTLELRDRDKPLELSNLSAIPLCDSV